MLFATFASPGPRVWFALLLLRDEKVVVVPDGASVETLCVSLYFEVTL